MKNQCEHEIIWNDKKWYGVYPRYIKGICKKCKKQFKKTKKDGKEYVEISR